MRVTFSRVRHRLNRWQKRLKLWQRGLCWLFFFALMFVTGGFAFIMLGLSPVSASAGHWELTNWFLHFAMRRAVVIRAADIEVPPLDDLPLVFKGAGHYATGCAPCHGAPDQLPSFITQQITPEPPFLPPKVHHWKPEQLFWIVKHGIKFSAMPAWPSLERDDEVWAMVAFLLAMPSLEPAYYRDMAFGPAEAGTEASADPSRIRALVDPAGPALANCIRCHGESGEGRGEGAFPKLAGQNREYLLGSMQAYAMGKRHSGIMEPIAAGLNEATISRLVQHFANLNPSPGSGDPTPEAIARGSRIAREGIQARGIPACAECHGPGPGERNPHYPNLAGQYGNYLQLQLELFKSGKRGGTPYAHIMQSIAKRLDEEQIRDLAAYYSSL